jgi:hypothetical protein
MRLSSIYKALDDYIENSKDDENKIKTEILKEMKFPLLQFDLNVISIEELHGREILVCREFEVIKVINESVHSRVILIDCDIANDCPNLMKLLNVIYFDEISVMYLQHQNNNMESENNNLNEIFCEVTQNPKFRVLKGKFLYFSLSFPKDFKTKLRDNHDSNDSAIRVDMHRSYAIIKNEYLICSDIFSPNDEVKMYVSALKDILNSDEISETVIRRIKNSIQNSRNWIISSLASEKSQVFNMNEIRFSTNISLNSQCEVYGRNKNENSRPKISYSNLQKEEIFFNNRIEQIKDLNVEVNRPIESKRVKNSSEIKSVDTEKQKIIGNRAEFFFNTYLKTKFGDSYNELLHWKSPQGRKYYLNDNAGCDDSLGYDFVVEDHLKLFSDKKPKQIQIRCKTCFIEVKGCSGAWDGTFFVSENEKEFKDSEITPETQSYIIVVIENVNDYSNIGIAAIINWTENNHLVRLEPNSYLATYASVGEQSDSRSRITDEISYSPTKRGITGTFKYYRSNGEYGFIRW